MAEDKAENRQSIALKYSTLKTELGKLPEYLRSMAPAKILHCADAFSEYSDVSVSPQHFYKNTSFSGLLDPNVAAETKKSSERLKAANRDAVELSIVERMMKKGLKNAAGAFSKYMKNVEFNTHGEPVDYNPKESIADGEFRAAMDDISSLDVFSEKFGKPYIREYLKGLGRKISDNFQAMLPYVTFEEQATFLGPVMDDLRAHSHNNAQKRIDFAIDNITESVEKIDPSGKMADDIKADRLLDAYIFRNPEFSDIRYCEVFSDRYMRKNEPMKTKRFLSKKHADEDGNLWKDIEVFSNAINDYKEKDVLKKIRTISQESESLKRDLLRKYKNDHKDYYRLLEPVFDAISKGDEASAQSILGDLNEKLKYDDAKTLTKKLRAEPKRAALRYLDDTKRLIDQIENQVIHQNPDLLYEMRLNEAVDYFNGKFAIAKSHDDFINELTKKDFDAEVFKEYVENKIAKWTETCEAAKTPEDKENIRYTQMYLDELKKFNGSYLNGPESLIALKKQRLPMEDLTDFMTLQYSMQNVDKKKLVKFKNIVARTVSDSKKSDPVVTITYAADGDSMGGNVSDVQITVNSNAPIAIPSAYNDALGFYKLYREFHGTQDNVVKNTKKEENISL